MNAPNCPDCNIPMEEGHILDLRQHAPSSSHWQPGPVNQESLFGLKFADTAQIDRERWREVVSYCCPKCYLLREYAPKNPSE